MMMSEGVVVVVVVALVVDQGRLRLLRSSSNSNNNQAWVVLLRDRGWEADNEQGLRDTRYERFGAASSFGDR